MSWFSGYTRREEVEYRFLVLGGGIKCDKEGCVFIKV